MSLVGQAVIVFLVTVVTDFFFGRYTITCAERKAVPASFWSMVYSVAYALLVIEYVHNPWLIAVVAVASAVGTYISIKWL